MQYGIASGYCFPFATIQPPDTNPHIDSKLQSDPVELELFLKF
jgi:hypothetical protein